MDRVIVVAPHPDDETLGCGGTLLKHRNRGDEINWVIVTNIDSKNGWSETEVKKRQNEIQEVSEMYGFKRSFKLGFPAALLDTIPYNDLISKMSSVIQEVKPSVVYLPNRSDIHTDHQMTFQAAMSCCKDFRSPFIKRILMYEVLSESEFSATIREDFFVPNSFVDISGYVEDKIKIMKVYASEIMEPPYPRCLDLIKCLAQYRGSRIGKQYAEAFNLLEDKWI
ncbi:MAG: PIG-L family deacetylase [Deltaproteobacteria bacterium]|nr:PIG-L family deacetylase [Deltaproteobacteria bacterium]